MTSLVFVYGTLTSRETASAVLPRVEYRGPATLSGLHRVEGDYPTLAPGGETSGRLLETAHVGALDRYEGVERGLYARVSVPLADGEGTVQVYVGDPQRLGVAVDWPTGDFFPAGVREYVRERDVRVTRDA